MTQVLNNLNNSTPAVREEVGAMVERNEGAIANALGERYDAKKYIRGFITYLRGLDWIGEVSKTSLAQAIMTAAQHGLNPLLGEVYLVKYKNEVKATISYVGLIKIITENTDCLSVYAEPIRKKDKYRIVLGNKRTIEHEVMDPNDRGEAVCYYAIAKYPTHDEIEIMGIAEIEKARKCAKDDRIWSQWYDEMAKKTVIRRLIKRLPKGNLTDIGDDDEERGQEVTLSESPNLPRTPAAAQEPAVIPQEAAK